MYWPMYSISAGFFEQCMSVLSVVIDEAQGGKVQYGPPVTVFKRAVHRGVGPFSRVLCT